MKKRKLHAILIASVDGGKQKRSIYVTDVIWQMAESIRAKMPNNPTMGETFESLVNFARMMPEAFDLALPNDISGDCWEMSKRMAKVNGLGSAGGLLDRLVSTVALFPERFFLDKPGDSVEKIFSERAE
jgi:hypothetical protein